MHANLAPLPIRAATLGSGVPLRPFAHTPSSAAFCQQALGQRQQQTRPVSTQLNNNATPPTSLATLKPAPLKTSRAQTTTIPPLSYILRTGLRANSTASSPSSSTKSPEKEAGEKLDWNSFFKLRASRRRYTLASSVIASCFTTVSGVQFLSTQDLESIGAQVMGLDPFVVFVLATIACGAGGWLVGPFFGSSVWGLIYRRHMPAFRVVCSISLLVSFWLKMARLF